MADDFSVLLKLLLDRDSSELTKKELKKITSLTKEADKAFKGQSLGNFTKYTKGIVTAEKATSSFRREQKLLQREVKVTKQVIQDLGNVQAIFAKKGAIAGRQAGILNSFGNQAAGAGLLIGGGIIAQAAAYAAKVGDATEGTRQFNVELKKIQSAKGRIDEVLVSAVLPILETASKVASTTAGILEKNPQLASLALKGAALLVAVGTLAKLAGTGFKIYADLTYFTAQGIGLEAANLQLLASNNQLLAAGKGIVGKAAPLVAGGAGLSGAIPAIGILIAGGFLLELERKGLNKILGTDSSFGDIGTTAKQVAALVNPLSLLSAELKLLGLDEASDKVRYFTSGLFGLNPAIDAAAASVEGLVSVAEDEASALKMMASLAQDLAKAERKFADDREDIFTDESRALDDAKRSLDKNLKGIASSLSKNISKINSDLKSNLASMASKFAESNVQAEADYQKQRNDIISQGAEETVKIAEQRQKDLLALNKDHNRTLADLAANRDALGIVLENEAFKDKQDEINSNAKDATEQARANTAQQLVDAQENYNEQRAQRLADYQQQKAEAVAQAAQDRAEAQAKAAEDRASALAADAEERAEIARKRAEALADLRKAYDRERSERITAVYNEIVSLRGALNAEALMRRQYQGLILADATAHMAALRSVQNSSLGGQATALAGWNPTHDYSGYAYTGNYAMAQDGQREYVLSGAATRAAEQMVGGQLNEQVLLGGLGGNMNYTDNGSYSGMTVADYRRIKQLNKRENLKTLSSVFRK